MKKNLLLLVAAALTACVLVVAGIAGYVWTTFNTPVSLPEGKQSVEIAVNARMTVVNAVEQLAEKNVIDSPELGKIIARVYARWTGKGVQSGVYVIPAGMTKLDAVLRFFSKANTETVMVTFQEGISLRRIASIANKEIGCNEAEMLRLMYSDSLLKARAIVSPNVEGYLLPNTYEFFKSESAADVLDRLLNAQREFWRDSAHAAQEKARGLTRAEILTLASIVEAETPVDDEKKRVAGVYFNRLAIDMKLEADPTVQYVLDRINPNRESRRVLYRDLETDSPYNTYKYKGLPPTPLNSPGAKAIEAALQPEAHKFLFFVAKADGSNTHTFTQTPAEHLKAVALYRVRRAENIRNQR
jgi:UPF0755 protein